MSGARFRALQRWLADALRFAGALPYWNTRKTLFVLRRRRGPAPCQNPSDDNVPGRIRCDAVAYWHEPARFRRVCPLLVRTPQGWCCSVAAGGVRPFWPRALAWSGLLLAGAYLGATLLGFAALRLTNPAPVGWTQVAWPGKWPEIRRLQAETLYGRAMQAFLGGRLGEAYLALSSARQRDPSHYEASLLLGQIAMFQGSFAHADNVFTELMQRHPAQRTRTAVTYHDTLLSLNRLDRLAELCLVMAGTDTERPALWVRSLLVALRLRGDAQAFLDARAGAVGQLAPHARLLLAAEARLAAGDRAGAVQLLRPPFRGPLNLVYMQQQAERLATLGEGPAAQALLDFYGPAMGEFEQLLSQLTLDGLARDEASARATLRQLLTLPIEPGQVERFAVRLIAQPDPAHFRALHARIAGSSAVRGSAGATVSLWAAALVCGAPEEAEFWRQQAERAGRTPLPPITGIDFASVRFNDDDSVAYLINVVTFPREVVLALLQKVARRPGPA